MSIVVNGSGTITGISTGGLPDGSVDVDTLAANSVTAAKIVDGTIVDAEVTSLAASKLTGALPAISAANLTNIPAANITGTLPAISGANLTGLVATVAGLTDATVSSSDPVVGSYPSATGHLWLNKSSGEAYIWDSTAGVVAMKTYNGTSWDQLSNRMSATGGTVTTSGG